MIDQVVQVPQWAILPESHYPVFAGAPRHYRFDGGVGKFYVGTETEQDALWLQPIEWRWQEGERWGRQNQNWLDLAFVDHEHVVSVCSFKKASAVNLFDYLTRLMSGRIYGQSVNPWAVWLLLTPSVKSTTEGDNYFAVTVGTCNFASEDQARKVSEFANSGVFDWVLVGEVDAAY